MTSIAQAFKDHGIRALYKDMPAVILPLDTELHADLGATQLDMVGQNVQPGQMLVSWTEDGQRRGTVLNTFAANDIVIKIAGQDDREHDVYASNMSMAAKNLIEMSREDVRERKTIAEANATLKADYEKAIEAGEAVDEPVYAVPTYADGAFTKMPKLVSTIKIAIQDIANSPWADITAKTQAFIASNELGRLASNVLSPSEMAKVAEMRSLRQAIGEIQPKHKDALPPNDAPYTVEDAGLAAREAVDALELGGRGFSDQQLNALAANPTLTNEVFGVLTTTPVSGITAQLLAHPDYLKAEQELARHEAKTWAPEATARISEVLSDRMPGYRFNAKIYTVDDADIMLVRDHAGAYLYSWDSASRVMEVNVKDKVLSTYGPDDVPSDEELHDLRLTLEALRYDNGEEVDFGWGDKKSDEDEMDPAAGMRDLRPEGY